MLARSVKHLRRNAVAYLALFFALSGTAYAVALPRNSVSTGNIVNGQVKRADIARNAVSSAHVRDVLRSVSLPLGSFTECESPAVGRDLDWTNDADGNADRAISTDSDRIIRWDDATGQGDDNYSICSEFMVPPDARDDFGVRVHAGKQQESGPVTEQITANINAYSQTIDMVTGTAPTLHVIRTSTSLLPGDTIKVALTAHAGPGTVIDDSVEIHSVDFVYRAAQ